MPNGEISYIYDASGRKVSKKVTDYNGAEPDVAKFTDYASGGFTSSVRFARVSTKTAY